jgi:hypothetical protein
VTFDNHSLELIMRTIKTASLISGFLGVSAVLVSTAAMSATPGKGWDVFNVGQGERITAVAKGADTSKGSPGKGWDVMRTGAGERVPDYSQDSKGESSRASKGWDVFNMGLGDPITTSKRHL